MCVPGSERSICGRLNFEKDDKIMDHNEYVFSCGPMEYDANDPSFGFCRSCYGPCFTKCCVEPVGEPGDSGSPRGGSGESVGGASVSSEPSGSELSSGE